MPLIKCPDCNSDVSDKSTSCIKCGYPIQDLLKANVTHDNEHELVVSDIQNDGSFKIGKQIVNWVGGGVLKNASSEIQDGDLGLLETGKFEIYRHKNGIRIRNSLFSLSYYDIHYRQIIDIDETNACLLYTSPSPRDQRGSRMPSSA